MKNGVERRVKEIVAGICNKNCVRHYKSVDPKKITDKHDFKFDLPVTHFSFLQILAKIEDFFDFNIEDNIAEELITEKLITVGDLVQCVKKQC